MKNSKKFGGKELTISNPDKVMYSDNRFTKSQVIEFYASIAPYVLPHIKERPITMKRFPNGVGGAHFYEKGRALIHAIMDQEIRYSTHRRDLDDPLHPTQ
jgi:DNA primase